MTKDGTLGRIAIVDQIGVCVDQSVAVLQPSDRIRSRFLHYLLEAPENLDRMIGDANGTTTKHIYITRLSKMIVQVPSPYVQDQVVGVLSLLDDRIELNRRTAATLEEMARALWRSWFVDFDPVRARASGQAPAFMDEATAALFPDRFGADGLPEGWRKAGLDEPANFLNGVTLQRYPPAEGERSPPVIKIAELRGGISANTSSANMIVPEKHEVRDGDVLFSWSGSLLQRRSGLKVKAG